MQNLRPRHTPGANVISTGPNAWRFTIPAGPAGQYRLAQLDDYSSLARGHLPWRPPLRLELRARVSAPVLPGTWGFGLWNDPFSLSFGLGGMARRFPALPNAAWFFFASPPNYLSFRDDLPARGFLAATFRSAHWPSPLLAGGSLALPLLFVPPLGRLLRRIVRRFAHQDAALVPADPTQWHQYVLDWQPDRVAFRVDGQEVLDTLIAPKPPQGLILWLDNQFAALPPAGGMSFGFLPNPEPAWLEIEQFAFSA